MGGDFSKIEFNSNYQHSTVIFSPKSNGRHFSHPVAYNNGFYIIDSKNLDENFIPLQSIIQYIVYDTIRWNKIKIKKPNCLPFKANQQIMTSILLTMLISFQTSILVFIAMFWPVCSLAFLRCVTFSNLWSCFSQLNVSSVQPPSKRFKRFFFLFLFCHWFNCPLSHCTSAVPRTGCELGAHCYYAVTICCIIKVPISMYTHAASMQKLSGRKSQLLL